MYTVTPRICLHPIARDGTPRGYCGEVPDAATEVCRATVRFYESVGFVEPWIGYLAVADIATEPINSPPLPRGDRGGSARTSAPSAIATFVGTGAFKSPPADGRVEIAYHTFPGFEGRGFATAMARELIAIATKHAPHVIVAAQTLPTRSASHRVLEKLGFAHVATLDHPEDGRVCEWHRTPKGRHHTIDV